MKMESNDKLKEIDIRIRACYYFNGKINIEDLDPDSILTDEKWYKNIIVISVLDKNLIAKPSRIRFDKIDGFIRVYDGTRYLLLINSNNN